MRFRPAGWPLPRPSALHHVVEDFLTDWTAPVGHILPLRRFLENCLDTDLRSFYAGKLGSQEDRGAELEGEDDQVDRRPVELQDARLEIHTWKPTPGTSVSYDPSQYSTPADTSASQVALVVKSPPSSPGDTGDAVLIPGSGRSLEENMATHSSTLT